MDQQLSEKIDGIKIEFLRDYEEWLKARSERESSKGEGYSAGPTGEIATRGDGGTGGGSGGRPSKPGREKTESEPPKDRAIHGFQNEILALKHFLLKKKDSEQFKTLAVVGRHGVGKTALCQTVFNDETVQKVYNPRIWVSMYEEGKQEEQKDPKKAIVERLLKNIKQETDKDIPGKVEAGNVGTEAFEKKDLSRLLCALHKNLGEKKYLIVLDDVHEDDEWKERLDEETPKDKEWKTHLSHGFPKGFGGRVICTSRDEKLAMKLVGKEENLHRLYPISDPDSLWKVYVDAEKEFNKDIVVRPRNEAKSKEELMSKSGGIPLVARMMGKIKPVDKDESLNGDQAAAGTEPSH